MQSLLYRNGAAGFFALSVNASHCHLSRSERQVLAPTLGELASRSDD